MSSALGKLHKQQQLAAHAHRMRTAPSEPERVLWSALRASQRGARFRRQVVLQGYIVDFLAPAARLVVEVDGAHHALRPGADKRRTALWPSLASGCCVCRRNSCRVIWQPLSS